MGADMRGIYGTFAKGLWHFRKGIVALLCKRYRAFAKASAALPFGAWPPW